MINAYLKWVNMHVYFPTHTIIHATAPSARARFAPIETRGDEAFRNRLQHHTQFKQQNTVIYFPFIPTTLYALFQRTLLTIKQPSY